MNQPDGYPAARGGQPPQDLPKPSDPFIHRSGDRYQHLFDLAVDAMFIHDLEGRFLEVNQAACQQMGYGSAELLQMSIRDIDAPEDTALAASRLQELQDAGQVRFEGHHISHDGNSIPVEIHSRIVPYEGQPVIFSIARDITHRKQSEARLRQAAKMEAVGRLAGGVAHDFNNCLTATLGYVSLLLSQISPDSPLYEDLQQIEIVSMSAANLTRQLLLFSRKQPLQFVPVNLCDVIQGMLKMLPRLLGEDIHIHCNLEPTPHLVRADEGCIQQVIMNLALNARDAMPNGGQLYLSAKNSHFDPVAGTGSVAVQPSDYISLSVRDTGKGMSQEVQSHLFEPFFTTKPEGHGTGLGLTTVYGIAKQHQGWIDVQSALGQGSTFTLYLPAIPPNGEAQVADAATPAAQQGTGECILLVEDHDTMREAVQRALASQGYTVFVADSINAALNILGQQEGKIDLLLCDVVLPDGSGLRLAEELRLHQPKLCILLSSGYLDDKSQWAFAQKTKGYHFIPKPYALAFLLRAIRQALDES